MTCRGLRLFDEVRARLLRLGCRRNEVNIVNMKFTGIVSTPAIVFFAVIIFGALSLDAAPGDLDPTFSGDGKLTDGVGRANRVVIQPDGKIVVVGADHNNNGFAVARYNPNGSPDTDFGGGDGKVTTDIGFSYEIANAVALQSDGKIVAVGTTWDGSGSQWGHFSLVRYNPDGSLDLTFGGGDGVVVTADLGTGWVEANAVAIQSDGKIVAAGMSDYFLYDFPELTVIRYNPDGSLDLPFGVGGKAKIPWGPGPFGGLAPAVENATSAAIQPDGKIIAAGYTYGFWDFSAVVRLNSNGSFDSTFGGGDGVVVTDIGSGADVAHSVAIQSDGKIVTAGYSNNGSNDDFALVRYTPSGSIDTTFDSDGKVVTPIGSGNDVARTVAVQSDGKILVAGYSDNGPDEDFALARYNSDGSPDTTFGGGDGKTTADFDSSEDSASGMALDSAGRAVVVGGSDQRFAIARFLLGPRFTSFDFDGDGNADISVFRPSDNNWYVLNAAGYSVRNFGAAGDVTVPADYDGDGKTDIAVWRPSNGQWYVLTSGGQFQVFGWGENGDLPLPADHDGDGRADLVLFRPSANTWHTRFASGGFTSKQFGEAGDKPVRGDFDGDGRADITVYRPSTHTWYFQNGTGFSSHIFGEAGDIPVPADYDGDGVTEVAVFRSTTGRWYSFGSSEGCRDFGQWGVTGDVPIPADYDGDGKADRAVFRSSDSNWYIAGTASGITVRQFGQSGDKPTPNVFIY